MTGRSRWNGLRVAHRADHRADAQPGGSLVSPVHQRNFLSGNLSAPHPRKVPILAESLARPPPAPPFRRCHTSSTIKPKQPPEVPPKISYHSVHTDSSSHDPLSPISSLSYAPTLGSGHDSPFTSSCVHKSPLALRCIGCIARRTDLRAAHPPLSLAWLSL